MININNFMQSNDQHQLTNTIVGAMIYKFIDTSNREQSKLSTRKKKFQPISTTPKEEKTLFERIKNCQFVIQFSRIAGYPCHITKREVQIHNYTMNFTQENSTWKIPSGKFQLWKIPPMENSTYGQIGHISKTKI